MEAVLHSQFTRQIQSDKNEDVENDLLETVSTLINRQECVSALAICISLSDKGNVRAVTSLELILRKWGNNPDLYEYCRCASEQKSSAATHALGYIHHWCHEEMKDYDKARTLYEQADGLGFRKSANNLGFMYYYGNGVTQNFTTAREYFETANDGDVPRAAFHLGNMYFYGQGVDKDYEMAYEYYKKAYALKVPEAAYILGYGNAYNAYHEDMTGCEEIRLFYEKAKTGGFQQAAYERGMDYLNGNNVDRKSHTRAREYLIEAYKLGHPEAAFQLGESYRTAGYFSGRQDHAAAKQWYAIAATNGSKQADARQILNKY